MDKKTAFKILNLNHSATLEQAKKAYHQMAKKFHPDAGGKTSESQKNAEEKMKEINNAFFFLVPLLKSGKKARRIQKDRKHKASLSKNRQHSFFLRLLKSFSNVFIEKKIRSCPTDNFQTKKSSKKSNNKKPVFRNILKNVYKGHTFNQINKTSNHNRSSYKIYQDYVILKKKIKEREARSDQGMKIGKVEKITPVRPVNPIGKD